MNNLAERLLTLQAIVPETFEEIFNEVLALGDVPRESIIEEVTETVFFDAEECPLFTAHLKQKAIAIESVDDGPVIVQGRYGYIASGDKKMPIYDIVITSKQNNAWGCFKLAERLSMHHGLLIESRSLYERGSLFAGVNLPSQEEVIRLIKPQSVKGADAIRSILMGYLVEVTDFQAAYLNRSEDPETLHHLRVKIRQLRSLLSLFRPMFTRKKFLIYSNSARELEHVMGRMRELDVLTLEWVFLKSEDAVCVEAVKRVTQILALEREKEGQLLYAAISKGISTPILLGISAWLHGKTSFKQAFRKTELKRFVDKRLMKWERRISKDLDSIGYLNIEEIHTLRIQCKKMRYSLECFAGWLKSDESKLQVEKLKKMQTLLGVLCDSQRSVILTDQILRYEQDEGIQKVRSLFQAIQTNKYEKALKALIENEA